MDILVNVVNQRLKIQTNLKTYVEGTQNFIRFHFNLPSEWDNLSTFAQFGQNGTTYDAWLDEDNCVYLPSEIVAGTCTLLLGGYNESVIGYTNNVVLTIEENICDDNAINPDITEPLIHKLVTDIADLQEWKSANEEDMLLSWIEF